MNHVRVKISCLLVFAALCGACVGTGENPYKLAYETYHDGMVAKWGPEQTWTTAQRQLYVQGLFALHNKLSAEASTQYRPAYIPQPTGYNPYIASGGVLPEEMLHRSQTTPAAPLGVLNANRYDPNSLANPYGAGSPYKADGLMNPYSQYGSPYSNKSWRNPYATDAPKLYDSQGKYHGRLSTNPYDADSTSNPYGRYGSKYSPDSINNPYGAGNPYSTRPIYVTP
jgi:hypothetical protein